jgi:hypothetical protein
MPLASQIKKLETILQKLIKKNEPGLIQIDDNNKH